MAAPRTLFTHPDGWRRVADPPTPAALKAFYAGEYFQASHGTYAADYTETERAHRALTAQTLLFALQTARGTSGGRLLEVGCGEGWLLAAASDAGYDVRGLDFSDDGLHRFHPNLAAQVSFGDAFENLERLIDDGARFDVVAMEHVLEHVLDPEALVRRLPRLIAPGGALAITAPNDFSPLQRLALGAGMVDREFWVAPPQHLNYFDAASLRRFLGGSGSRSAWPTRASRSTGSSSTPARTTWRRRRPARTRTGRGWPSTCCSPLGGMAPYLALGEALFGCGAGRSLTVIAQPTA